MTEEQLAAKYTSGLIYSIQKYVLWHNMFSLNEAHNLTVETEEMVIWSSPFMRIYQSHQTAEQHQQQSIEEQ